MIGAKATYTSAFGDPEWTFNCDAAAGNWTLLLIGDHTMGRVEKVLSAKPIHPPPAPRSGGDQQPAGVNHIEVREDYPNIPFY